MTEWGVIIVIVTLVGLMATIIPPIVRLTRAITELTSTVKFMETQVSKLTADNDKSHQRIWDHNDKQDAQLDDHEKRIFGLEKTHENK